MVCFVRWSAPAWRCCPDAFAVTRGGYLERRDAAGREFPVQNRDPELLFQSDEWRAVFVLDRKKPPKTPLRLNEVVRLIAMPGGFLARQGDREPGARPSGKACGG